MPIISLSLHPQRLPGLILVEGHGVGTKGESLSPPEFQS